MLRNFYRIVQETEAESRGRKQTADELSIEVVQLSETEFRKLKAVAES